MRLQRHSAIRSVLVAVSLLLGASIALGGPTSPAQAQQQLSFQSRVNMYRRQSGLAPVSINTEWKTGVVNHACYLGYHGLVWFEETGSAFWSREGQAAASNSIKARSNTPNENNFVDGWMASPYHAQRLLRAGWKQTYSHMCEPGGQGGDRRTYSIIDTERGNDGSRPTSPVVYPGRNATSQLTTYLKPDVDLGDLLPNPQDECNYRGTTGLPLLVMFPQNVFDQPKVSLTDPNGRALSTCTLWKGRPGLDDRHKFFTDRNTVIIMPSRELRRGTHSATVTAGDQSVTWNFNILSASKPPSTTSPTTPPTTSPTTPPRGGLSCNGKPATIVGTSSKDRLVGTSRDDVIHGAGGNDTIFGGGGNDVICGGDGNDVIYSGVGSDRVYGEAGSDRIWAGKDNDLVDGGDGTDTLFGELGNDRLQGGKSADQMIGGEGNDAFYGGGGNDTIRGGDGDDRAWAGKGDDRLLGEGGRDRLYGELGKDSIDGGPDRDVCVGERKTTCEA